MPDRLTTLFADVLDLDAAELTDATSQANTPAWDSLASINLTVAIEEEFGVKLGTKDVLAMTSIGAARVVLQDHAARGVLQARGAPGL
jgi:acyl carrier protein